MYYYIHLWTFPHDPHIPRHHVTPADKHSELLPLPLHKRPPVPYSHACVMSPSLSLHGARPTSTPPSIAVTQRWLGGFCTTNVCGVGVGRKRQNCVGDPYAHDCVCSDSDARARQREGAAARRMSVKASVVPLRRSTCGMMCNSNWFW